MSKIICAIIAGQVYIRDNVMPNRCVLNGLETVRVPPELEQLDALSVQLIQLAKCYQTVRRLGTYTKKVYTNVQLTQSMQRNHVFPTFANKKTP